MVESKCLNSHKSDYSVNRVNFNLTLEDKLNWWNKKSVCLIFQKFINLIAQTKLSKKNWNGTGQPIFWCVSNIKKEKRRRRKKELIKHENTRIKNSFIVNHRSSTYREKKINLYNIDVCVCLMGKQKYFHGFAFELK